MPFAFPFSSQTSNLKPYNDNFFLGTKYKMSVYNAFKF